MRFTSFITFTSLGLALVACRGSSSNNTDGNTGDTGSGGSVKIQDVQNDQMLPGTPVSLSGVVVTAIDNFGGKVGDIWVEEPEGGPFSGVHIYKADPTAVSSLAVGDIVNISGAVKDEFALSGSNADPTARTETELKPSAMGSTITVTKTGTGTVPAPANVDALMIGQLADADMQGTSFSAAWEMWEGVLIKTSNVTALGAPKSFGSTMPTPADNYSFGITGVAKVEGSLTDIKSSGIMRNSCLASVTGVVSYFYDYLLLPTQASDLATGGTGCPALEVACSDTIDNDGNGFNDCGDNNCITTQSSCRMTTTISAIDQAADANPTMPTFPVTGGVEIDGVYVTAIAGTNFYVSSSAAIGASDGGLYVFGAGQALPTGLAVGSKVNLVGNKVQAYNNDTMGESLTEFNLLAATIVTGTGAPAPKPNMSISTLSTTATARPYVGSLVTMSAGGPFKLTTAESTANHQTGTLTSGSTTILINGTITPDADAVNTCYSAVTGLLTYDVYSNAYEIVNTAAPTAGTGCP